MMDGLGEHGVLLGQVFSFLVVCKIVACLAIRGVLDSVKYNFLRSLACSVSAQRSDISKLTNAPPVNFP